MEVSLQPCRKLLLSRKRIVQRQLRPETLLLTFWWLTEFSHFEGVIYALDDFCNPHHPLASGVGIPRGGQSDPSFACDRPGCRRYQPGHGTQDCLAFSGRASRLAKKFL
jgi:hypothetical protein